MWEWLMIHQNWESNKWRHWRLNISDEKFHVHVCTHTAILYINHSVCLINGFINTHLLLLQVKCKCSARMLILCQNKMILPSIALNSTANRWPLRLKSVVSVNGASEWVALMFLPTCLCEPHSERFFRKRKAFEIMFSIYLEIDLCHPCLYIWIEYLSHAFSRMNVSVTGVDVSWIYPLSYQTGTRALIFPPPLYLSLTDIPRQVTTCAVLSHRVPLSLPSLVFNLLPLFKDCVICHSVSLKLD